MFHAWMVCEAVAHVAQLAEHVLGKDEVTRSIRVVGSRPRLRVPLDQHGGVSLVFGFGHELNRLKP